MHRRPAGHALAATALLLAGAAPAAPALARTDPPARAAAAPPAPRIAILTRTEDALRRGRRLRVLIRFGAVGRVRVMVRVRGGGRFGTRLLRARLLSFRRPGRRRVSLRLTASGRRLLRRRLRGCQGRLRLVVLARGRRYRRVAGRRLFSPRNKSRRSRWHRRVRRLRAPACVQAGAPGGGGPGATLRAGAAASDLTPPIGTPMFAYTARSGFAGFPDATLQILGDPDENFYAKTFAPSEGIHTRVLARAIVLERAGDKLALVQTDLGGLPYALLQEVAGRVQATGIAKDRIMLSATHTHSSTGPIWPNDSGGYAALGGDLFDRRIFDLTAEAIAEAIRAANQNLEPARLGVGTAEVRDASSNRGFEPFRQNVDVPADEDAARAASIDPQVTVLRVDSAEGRPIGVWSNFAIHATSFGDENLLFSGDNPGVAERVAEAAITAEAAAAGKPPSADRPVVNVWTNANEGDISPNGSADTADGDPLQYVPNDFAASHRAGTRVGEGIVRAWRDAAGAMSDAPALGARRSFVKFDGTEAGGAPHGPEPVGPTAILGHGGITADDHTCWPVGDNPVPGQGKKAPFLGGPAPPPPGPSLVPDTAPVSVWRVGSLGIVALPSEVTKQQGLRIRDRLTADAGGAFERTVLAGLSDGYISYTATPEEYDYCNYEGSFTLFGRQQGPRYQEFARGVLGALLGGPPPPGAAAEPPPTAIAPGPPDSIQETPNAGQVLEQPADAVRRFERATFRWRGADPAVDAPRGKVLVSLQREVAPGDWRTVGTDESFFDTTQLADPTSSAGDEAWTETWQFTECDPLGTYRFRVTGVKGAAREPYETESEPFQLLPTAPLASDAATVAGGTASVIARYPDPGDQILVALPRRVRSGFAKLSVTPPGGSPTEVIARPDAQGLRFTASVAPGSAATVTQVDDGCGNVGP